MKQLYLSLMAFGLLGVMSNAAIADEHIKPNVVTDGYMAMRGMTDRGTWETFFIDPKTHKVMKIMGTSPQDAIEYQNVNEGKIPAWFGHHGVEISAVYDGTTEYVVYVHKATGEVFHSHENPYLKGLK